jgi:hypothetical protein
MVVVVFDANLPSESKLTTSDQSIPKKPLQIYTILLRDFENITLTDAEFRTSSRSIHTCCELLGLSRYIVAIRQQLISPSMDTDEHSASGLLHS